MPFPLTQKGLLCLKQQDAYPLSVCTWEEKRNSQVYTSESQIYRHTQTELGFPKQFFLLLYSRVVIINAGMIQDLGEKDVAHGEKYTRPLKRSISE